MTLADILSTRRAFVLYRSVLRADGKLDKIPTHPADGISNIDGQDSRNWLLPAEAQAYADAWGLTPAEGVSGYGIGLIISEGCGLAFIDLDKCRDGNGGWLPIVAWFESQFPGAYTETSISRGGRHIVCSYTGTPPIHGTRNKTYHAEAYTKARFMAVGDVDIAGSPFVDCTAQLFALLTTYFPKNKIEPGEWHAGPVPEWKGPSNDDELLRRALASRGSVAKAFKGEATFADLWNNTAKVAATYANDESGADMALANHLGFWTGYDCDRMLRLMQRDDCGLRRDKWNRVDNYLVPTILRAVADSQGFEVYHEAEAISAAPSITIVIDDGVPPPPSDDGVPPPPSFSNAPPPPEPFIFKRGMRLPSGSLVTIADMKAIFEGYVYIEDADKILFPDGHMANKARFDNMLGGVQFCLTPDGQKPTKSAWEAYALNEMYTFPRVSTTNFKPNLPTGAQTIDGRISMANSYYPANIRRVQGDVTPFLDFVKRLLPEGRDAEILIAFMAACTRYLGVKFTWCPFIQGTKGNGKTTIAKILQYCISHDYTHWAKANELKEKYNSHLLGKILVVVDEMYSDDKAELQELLKELVTSDRVEIRAMYADKFMKDVCFNMLLISNHQNGVRVDANERRYAPLFCAQQEKADNARDGLTKPYFRELWSWLKADGFAIIYDYLLTVDIPEDLDPTKGATIAPETTSTERAALQSLGNIEQEIANAIEQQQDGFRGGWLSEHALDLLLARLGKDKFTPRTLRRSMIRALGYDPHPALADGVCAEPLPDGVRTRLYIRKGHAWAVAHLTPAQVRDGFVEHQKLAR